RLHDQRLGDRQTLIMKPRVLLLDEPFGALDPGIRKDMHGLLLELWNETGVTVFMVTHDLSEGFSLEIGRASCRAREINTRRHTRFSRDWSSDVCSSDLGFMISAWAIARR